MRNSNCCPGEILFDPRYAVFRGRLKDTDPHAHATGQWMAAGAGQRVEVQLGDGSRLSGSALVIAPQMSHAVIDPRSDVVVVWFDASRLDTLDSYVASGTGANAVKLTPALAAGVAAVLAAASGNEFRSAARKLVERVLAGTTDRYADAVVATAIDWLDRDPSAMSDARELAQRLGITAGTLARRFRSSVGMAPRAYRLWARLKLGLAHAADGANLTEAAHAAGFADAAHFTRTFRRHFGLAPSQVAPLLSGSREAR